MCANSVFKLPTPPPLHTRIHQHPTVCCRIIVDLKVYKEALSYQFSSKLWYFLFLSFDMTIKKDGLHALHNASIGVRRSRNIFVRVN